MYYKPAGFIPYTEKQWNEFLERLAITLRREAISCGEVMNDPQAMEFIKNYADEHFINAQKVLNIKNEGITYKLVNMEVNEVQYMIVHEYHGHHLFKAGYFTRNGASIEMKWVDVIPTGGIILLN